MNYAYVDESGTDSPHSGSKFLVVALLSSMSPRELIRVVDLARRRYGPSVPSGEMKASLSRPEARFWVLTRLAKLPVAITVAVVDKTCIRRPPRDVGEIYRLAVSRVVHLAAGRDPELQVCIDRRYTKTKKLIEVQLAIEAAVATIPGQRITIAQEDSVKRGELQAVDYVAWACHEMWEHDTDEYYKLIAAKVIGEELITKPLW